ncbi:hypothetical protein LX32DRAFT_639003 [Colletotrichum zoysiae]|uniref:Uncharacterized protein n=1 Tax=Colletotrichum zoysiae TaxID=1216348 RepID=A0AAD9M2D8_9PEZI|nr:hypothetical protein LX32DRAFT_639003 [Colletotrichum zoysiae]
MPATAGDRQGATTSGFGVPNSHATPVVSLGKGYGGMAWYGKCGSHARAGMSKAEVRPSRMWKFERIFHGTERGRRGKEEVRGERAGRLQPPEASNQAAGANDPSSRKRLSA